MAELTVDFDQPYIGGGGQGISQIPPWMVSVAGRKYVLDTQSGKYGRSGVQVLQQRNTNNQRDTILLPQAVWRQMTESWHQGTGQLNADREDSLPYRFTASYGIDPWDRYQFKLLNETAMLMTLPGAPNLHPAFVQVHTNKLAVIENDTVFWFDTPGATVHPQSISGASAQAIDFAYDGDAIFTLHDDGSIYRITSPSSVTPYTYTLPADPAPPSKSEATFIEYVKDHLILGVGNILYDITGSMATPTPTTTVIYKSPVTGWRWKGAAEGNTEIYLIGGSNDHHVIHRVGIKQDGTGLDPCVVAAALPDGEEGYSIGGYLGFIFVGTSKGVRMATLTSTTYVTTGNLTLGAVIPDTDPCYAFEGQDRFLWFTDSNIESGIPGDDKFPAGNVCGLARMDLSTFTISASTPAYAHDIVAADQTGKTVRSVCTWLGLRVFTVDGGGVYMETETKMPGGWIVQGRISFSVEDLKTSLYCQGKWDPLPAGSEIEMYLSYDSGPFSRVMTWGQPDTIRSGNIPMYGTQFSRIDSRIDLHRSSTHPLLGPTFTRFEVRARPVRGFATRWSLPILNSESLDLNGVIEARDVTAEYKHLMDLVESGRMFPLQEWGQTYQVVAVDFEWLPSKLNIAGTGWQGVFTLIVEEAK